MITIVKLNVYTITQSYIYEFIDNKDDVYFWPKIVNSYHPKTILEVA